MSHQPDRHRNPSWRFWLWALLDQFVLLPFAMTFFAMVTFGMGAIFHDTAEAIWVFLNLGMIAIGSHFGGKLRVISFFQSSETDLRIRPIPNHGLVRFFPVVIASSYTLLVACYGMLQPIPESSAVFGPFVDLFGITHPFTTLPIVLVFTFQVPNPWWYLAVPLFIQISYGFGMARSFRVLRAAKSDPRGRAIFLGAAATLAVIVISRGVLIRRNIIDGGCQNPTPITDYQPFATHGKLIKVADPGLSFAPNAPRLDGEIAFFPIYAAAAQAIYDREDQSRIRNSETPAALERLLAGETDIIFVAQPSDTQMQDAKKRGVNLKLHHIANDAFVFLVHEDNPADSLTTRQIRKIYTQSIRDWSELGGGSRKIRAYQHPEGSDSQNALLKFVMHGQPPFEPQLEEISEMKLGISRRVASYRNTRGSIGCAFQISTTSIRPFSETKLLAIDGISPDADNVRNGTYPFIAGIYAVTAGEPTAQEQQFIDWFDSPAGRDLIEKTGCIPVGSAE